MPQNFDTYFRQLGNTHLPETYRREVIHRLWLLCSWLDDCEESGIPVSGAIETLPEDSIRVLDALDSKLDQNIDAPRSAIPDASACFAKSARGGKDQR